MGNYITQGVYVRMGNLRIRGMKRLKVICVVLLVFLPGILVTVSTPPGGNLGCYQD